MINRMKTPTKTIVLVLPRGHEQSARITSGAAMGAAEYPCTTLLELPYEDAQREIDLGDIQIDGAIVWAYHDSVWMRRLLESGIPVINCGQNWIEQGVWSVTLDWETFATDLVTKIKLMGRQSVAILAHHLAYDPFKRTWVTQFVRQLSEQGLSPQLFECTGLPSEERQRLFHPDRETELIRFLEQLPLPAVVYCDDDYLAALACRVGKHLRQEIPRDLAVLGFGDFTISRVSSPTISTIDISGVMIGRQAFDLLRQRLESPQEVQPQVRRLPLNFIERESFRVELVKDALVAEVNRLIEEEACQGINVDGLARRLKVSRNTLNRRFQQEYGVTPGKKLRTVRADFAKRMLVDSDHSITKVSELCGFSEPANFVNFFKREVNCTPNEYRHLAQGVAQ
ncbi:MAG: helix-turn-helix domain-containing protein [Pirellulaceae bacterium]